MILTKFGSDYLEIDENNLEEVDNANKIHIIELSFSEPTLDKLKRCIDKFSSTKRYVVKNNIKFYNDFFKRTEKKYYIENFKDGEESLLYFFRKNNKVILNFENLDEIDKKYCLDKIYGILRSSEIIKMKKSDYLSLDEDVRKDIESFWNGNMVFI